MAVMALLQMEPVEWNTGPQPQVEGPGLGMALGMLALAAAAAVLFGFWGKTKAEAKGMNPWVGFCIGFFTGYIGIRLMDLAKLKSSDIFVKKERLHLIAAKYDRQPYPSPQPPPPYPAPPPGQPSYAPAPGQPPLPPQPQVYPQQAQAYPQQAQAYPPPQQPYPHPQPQPSPDKDGFMQCRACGTRVKAERRHCMQCGAALG